MCWLPKVQMEGERIPEKVRSSPQPWIRPTQDDKSTILFQQQQKHKDFIKHVGRNSNWQKSVSLNDMNGISFYIKADSPLFSLWLYTLHSLMCVTFDPVWLEVQDINTRTLDHGWSESNQNLTPWPGQQGWGTLLLLPQLKKWNRWWYRNNDDDDDFYSQTCVRNSCKWVTLLPETFLEKPKVSKV